MGDKYMRVRADSFCRAIGMLLNCPTRSFCIVSKVWSSIEVIAYIWTQINIRFKKVQRENKWQRKGAVLILRPIITSLMISTNYIQNHHKDLKKRPILCRETRDNPRKHKVRTKLARGSYLHRTRIQRAMVHHHLGKKIQLKRSHDGKLSFFF